MKRIAAFLCACCFLLSGCSVDGLKQYSYRNPNQSYPKTELTLILGQEEWLIALSGQLSEIIAARSNGEVTLMLSLSENPLQSYEQGEADLIFLSNETLRQDKEFATLEKPFMMPEEEDAVAYLNGPRSPLTNSQFLSEQYGAFLGAYYDEGAWMGVVTFSNTDLAGKTIGTTGETDDGSFYFFLGAESIMKDTPENLVKKTKAGLCDVFEFWPSTMSEQLDGMTIIPSRHRISVRALFLQKPIEEDVMLLIKEAIAETISSATLQRMTAEQSKLMNADPAMIGDKDCLKPTRYQAHELVREKGSQVEKNVILDITPYYS